MMLSICKPVQLFVNMQIERYGKEKGFHHNVFLFKNFNNYYDGKYKLNKTF